MYLISDFGLWRDLKYNVVKGVRSGVEKVGGRILGEVVKHGKGLIPDEDVIASRVANKIKQRKGLPNYKAPLPDDKPVTIAIHGLGGGRRNKNLFVDEINQVPEISQQLGDIQPMSPRSFRYKKGFMPSSPKEFIQRIGKASYSPNSVGEAQHIANKVIEARRQGKKVNVLGHSMGGRMAERVGRILDKSGFNDEHIKYTSLAGFRPNMDSPTNVPNFRAVRGKRDNALPANMFKGDEDIVAGAKHDALSLLKNPAVKKRFADKEYAFSRYTEILR